MSNILNSFSLAGKTALVTGASRGLGQGIALALADAGANIIAVATRPPKETAAKIIAMGRECHALGCDLSDRAQTKALFPEALTHVPHIDILANCAGTIRRADFTQFSEDDWDYVMRTNIDAVFFLSQAFVRQATAHHRPGKIINIASMLSYQGGIRVASYTSSKSALIGLTRLMANEFAAKNINVNGIAPGYMETDNTAALRADAERNAAILARIPAGRWGTPEDLQGAAVFLASRASDYINGFTIAVDGGWLAR